MYLATMRVVACAARGGLRVAGADCEAIVYSLDPASRKLSRRQCQRGSVSTNLLIDCSLFPYSSLSQAAGCISKRVPMYSERQEKKLLTLGRKAQPTKERN